MRGKAPQKVVRGYTAKDHPRLCGEKAELLIPEVALDGSPPPMRGKEHVAVAVVCLCRITPAYAGKSRRQGRKQLCTQDHPRLCGEKADMVRRMLKMGGSPPPMRGKEATCGITRLLVGITPAYAGKRLPVTARCRSRGDHPRLCGEKGISAPPIPLIQGSPPPMRGKGRSQVYHGRSRGITPAYAGKSGMTDIVWES